MLPSEQLSKAEQQANALIKKMLGPDKSRKSYALDIEAMRRHKEQHVTTQICDNYDALTLHQKTTVTRHLTSCSWCQKLADQLQRFKDTEAHGTTHTSYTA